MGTWRVHRGAGGRAYTLALPDGDYMERDPRNGRPYERHLLSVVRALQPALALDVGANVGNHAVNWATSGIDVVAVEPNVEALRFLEQNVEDNALHGRVTVVHKGCGAVSGRAKVVPDAQGNLGMAQLVAEHAGDIEVTTVDELRVRPDVIKIDVEGGELDVLRGAVRTIEACRPAVVVEAHNDFASVKTFLARWGYRVVGPSIAWSPTFLLVSRREHWRRAVLGVWVHGTRIRIMHSARSVARVLGFMRAP